jgi:hypothetical protein
VEAKHWSQRSVEYPLREFGGGVRGRRIVNGYSRPEG